jgi:murein DD-endopeptidase MepM/ murein hydrolase activator NlpD
MPHSAEELQSRNMTGDKWETLSLSTTGRVPTQLDTITVLEGAAVKTGDSIGTVGYSGNAAALKTAGLPPHLHFALIQEGKSALADGGRLLRQMKEWADYWQSLGADLTGAVNPGLFISTDESCWKGSTTVNAPGEK